MEWEGGWNETKKMKKYNPTLSYNITPQLKMSTHNTELVLDNPREVLANKQKYSTTQDTYQSIYMLQLLEISKLAISFLLSTLLIKLLDHTLFRRFQKYNVAYSILLVVMLVCIITLAASVFTYVKIVNDKNTVLQNIMSQ
jgi:hypothetical protein